MAEEIFPALENWEPTHKTLQLYAKVIGVMPRAHAKPHSKWWHISLKVQPDGLRTDDMNLPGGGKFWLKMNLVKHQIVLATDKSVVQTFDMTAGLTATQMGDAVLAAVDKLLGQKTEYLREKFENNEPRQYHPKVVAAFLTALLNADRIFKEHRANLHGEVSPVQFWPHGFDLSMEWFGTRQVHYQENGEARAYSSQLNLGFSPGEPNHPEPYFYSCPFPFEREKLVSQKLPEGASWFDKGWVGTILPYADLAGDPNAEARLREYAGRVYDIAAPLLTE